MRRGKSVLLLHDQLQDSRIWIELEPVVSAYATVLTISPPPLHTLGPPAAWADHIVRHARDLISPDGVEVVTTIGGAGEAGIELVSGGHARSALLIDPDLTPLAGDRTGTLFADEAAGTRLEQFFDHLEPHVEGFSTNGTLSEEGISTLVTATFQHDQDLPRHHQELLRKMMTEQLHATLPLDMEAQHRSPPERPDWVTRLEPVADRCVIATNLDQRLSRLLDVEATLRSRVPGVSIVNLTESRTSLLAHPPPEIGALIHSLLQP